MNPKQRKFAELFIELGSATEAAKQAGYSAQTAYAIAGNLLKKVEVQQHIQALLDAQTKDRMASASEIMATLTAIMRGEKTEEVTLSTPDGVEVIEKKPSLKDRIRAAELLGKRQLLWTERTKADDELKQAKIRNIEADTTLKQKALNPSLGEAQTDDGFLDAINKVAAEVWDDDEPLQ